MDTEAALDIKIKNVKDNLEKQIKDNIAKERQEVDNKLTKQKEELETLIKDKAIAHENLINLNKKAGETNKLLIIQNKQDSDQACQEQIEKFKEFKTSMEEKTNELDKINENASAIAVKVALEKIINKEEDAKLREKKL